MQAAYKKLCGQARIIYYFLLGVLFISKKP